LSEKASEVDQLKARIQALEDENEDLKRKLAIASPQ
jgi:cell division protein FtsB